MKKLLAVVFFAVQIVGSVGVGAALAQIETFMFVPGIKGSSVDQQHKDWIDVASLTQTLEQVRRSPQCTLEVIKGLDVSGPLLWAAAVTGQVFPEIVIDVTTGTQGKPIVIYQIKLANAHVRAISTVGNGGYVERVMLDARSVNLRFVPQNSDGSTGTPVTSSFPC